MALDEPRSPDSNSGAPAPGRDVPDMDAAVSIPVTEVLDLHAFRPRDILQVVADYLDEAIARGFTEVRLIHGKGVGLQRDRIQRLLTTHPRVVSFQDAPPERGHWGATVVRLR